MGPNPVLNHPLVLFLICVIVLWGSAWVGAFLCASRGEQAQGEDFDLILGATLTLLALIIGFSFSMAINRYDQRKTFEAEEADAIRTELVRVELLPAAEAASASALLRRYTDERILFYTTRGPQRQQIDVATAQLQADLWSAIRPAAVAEPTAMRALIVSGMTDVLNSQGHTQAAWWNRIPIAAWSLMILVAIFSNVLVGYDSRRTKKRSSFLLILPVLVSIAFLLIAELDSPRGGLIPVSPQNLLSLSESLRRH